MGGTTNTLINQGLISADIAGDALTITPSVFTNQGTGTVEARNGATLTLTPTNLTNLSGTTLTGGSWKAFTGATLSIDSTVGNGGSIVTNAADITLSGAGSVLRVRNPVTAVFTNLETSLTGNTAVGALHVLAGRNYTTANAFSNAGILELGGGTFTAASLTNSGNTNGFGTVTPQIANTGSVIANGGLLAATNGIVGATGTVQVNAGGSLAIGANSTAGTLIHNGNTAGSLALGANSITVSSDYQNANFGVGNSFNHRANVSGSGQILAAGANPGTAQTLSGNITPTPTTGNALMNFGNVHVGQSTTLNYQIGNLNPGGPNLLGAIQTSVNGGNITDARLSGAGVTASNWSAAQGGNTGNLAVTFNATSVGSLSGQQIHVRNNFDNTDSQNLAIQAAGFRLAQPNSIDPISFGSVLVGSTQTRTVSISNLAAADGFSEALNAAFGTLGGLTPTAFSTSGAINQLAAGANNNANMIVTLNTGSAGTFSANVQILLNSDGTGTSGLGITTLPTQVINLDGLVTGSVGNLAQAGPHSPEPVVFGNVRVGAVVPSQTLSISNVASGLAEGLNGSIGTASPGLTASGAFTNLAPGATNNSSLSVGITTATAGSRNGTATITLASDGAFNGGTPTSLPSQTVNVQGGSSRWGSRRCSPASTWATCASEAARARPSPSGTPTFRRRASRRV